jgi:hypothetical protein
VVLTDARSVHPPLRNPSAINSLVPVLVAAHTLPGRIARDCNPVALVVLLNNRSPGMLLAVGLEVLLDDLAGSALRGIRVGEELERGSILGVTTLRGATLDFGEVEIGLGVGVGFGIGDGVAEDEGQESEEEKKGGESLHNESV